MAFDGLVKKLRNTTAVAGLGLAALLPMTNKASAQSSDLTLNEFVSQYGSSLPVISGQELTPDQQYVLNITGTYMGTSTNVSLDALFNASASNSNIRMDSVGPNGTTCNLSTGPVTLNNGSVIDFYNPSASLTTGTSTIAQFYFTPTSEGGTFHISPNTTPGSIQVYQGETPWNGNVSWDLADSSWNISGLESIPEPSSLALIAAGLATVGIGRALRGRKRVFRAGDGMYEASGISDSTGTIRYLGNVSKSED
jgi:hypothetical protein